MTYYLVRYHYKYGADGVVNSVAKSLGEAYDIIESLQRIDAKNGTTFDWLYNVVAVETTEEYPAPEWEVQA